MKNTKLRFSAVIASLSVGAFLAGCGASGEAEGGAGDESSQASWTGYTYTTSDTVLDPLEQFGGETLPSLTGDAVDMTMHPGGALGIGAADIAQAVGSNSLQFASDGFYHGSVPLAGVLALPMLYETEDEVNEAIELAMPTLEPKFREIGVEVVGRYVYPLQTFFTTKPVTSIDDIKGLKIRVSSPEQAALVEALGANPITIGTPEVPGALQQGVVDGVLTASSGGAKTYPELLSHNYRLPVNPVVSMLEVNAKAYDALSQEDQSAVKEAATEMGNEITATMADEEESLTRQFEEDGMVVTEADAKDIEAAASLVKDFWQEWATKQGTQAEQLLSQVLDGQAKLTGAGRVVCLHQRQVSPRDHPEGASDVSSKIFRLVLKLPDWLSRASMVVSAAMIVMMMALVAFDVTLRKLAGGSTQVATEFSGYMLVAVTFFSASYSLRSGSFIRVTLLYERFPDRIKSLAQLLFDFLSLGYIVVLTYYAFALASNSYRAGTISAQLSKTPQYLPQAAMVIGLGVLVVVLLAEIVKGATGAGRRHSGVDESREVVSGI